MTPGKADGGADALDKSPGAVGKMFDLITPTYDRLNNIMSLSMDRRWRRAAIQEVRDDGVVLDIATGTGDMAIELARRRDGPIVGVDISPEMMRIAGAKWATHPFKGAYSLVQGDAMALPFRDATFSQAMVAFGIRNMSSLDTFLSEAWRVLEPRGRLVVLELSMPRNQLLRALLRSYLLKVLPMVARLQGGDPAAYRYLSASIISFPPPHQVEESMRKKGFTVVRSRSLSMGACHLYVGEKVDGSSRRLA